MNAIATPLSTAGREGLARESWILERLAEMVGCRRRLCELEMTNEFCPHLSLHLDLCLAMEQTIEEEGRPC